MNMTIKELQTTCDDLYYQFVCRLSKVTEFETIDKGDRKVICLYTDKNHNDYVSIAKMNNGDIWFWTDDVSGLFIGTTSDHNLIDVRLNTLLGLKKDFKRYFKKYFKMYTSRISDKPLHYKKRAILLELKTKLETLLKDYL